MKSVIHVPIFLPYYSLFKMSRVVRKPDFCICENKDPDQLCSNPKLISAFVFATHIVQSFFFLNPKFQACSYLLWPYSLVWVGPGRKPRRPVFSQRGSNAVFCFCITALFDAVEHQDLDAVKEILETNGLDVNRYVLLNLATIILIAKSPLYSDTLAI